MDVFKGKKKKDIAKSLITKLGGNKVVRSTPRAAMFFVSFANFKSRDLVRYLAAPRVIT